MFEERFSALLDGECSAAEVRQLLTELAALTPRTTQVMAAWSRMIRVREALVDRVAHHRDSTDVEQFCASVMNCLDAMEPDASGLVPPSASKPSPSMPGPLKPGLRLGSPIRTIPTRAVPVRTISIPSAWRRRSVRGWAAAASITLLMLIGGRAWFGHPADRPLSDHSVALYAPGGASGVISRMQPQTIVADSGSSGGLMPIPVTAAAEPAEVRWTQLDPDTASELNVYLTEHNSSRADQGMNGALGYARLAARKMEYRPNDAPR